MRIAETISRRSTASGWRRAMVRMALLLDLALQHVEPRVGGDHRLGERRVAARRSAVMASASIFSAMPPISAMRAAQILRGRCRRS